MTNKSVLQECPKRVSHKSVPQECPTRVPHKSVPKECPTRVTYKSVAHECPTSVSYRSASQECTRVSHKCVSYKSVKNCLSVGFEYVFAFGFMGSILFYLGPRVA